MPHVPSLGVLQQGQYPTNSTQNNALALVHNFAPPNPLAPLAPNKPRCVDHHVALARQLRARAHDTTQSRQSHGVPLCFVHRLRLAIKSLRESAGLRLANAQTVHPRLSADSTRLDPTIPINAGCRRQA